MLYDKEMVMKYLPHRDPFLFIDSVVDIRLAPALASRKPPFKPSELIGSTSICLFRIDEKLDVLRGHFPGNPIVPGVLQIEMMAQAASFLCTRCVEKIDDGVNLEVALLGVDGAKFRKPLKPNMDLVITATLLKVRGPIMSYECSIQIEDDIVSECHILASLKFK